MAKRMWLFALLLLATSAFGSGAAPARAVSPGVRVGLDASFGHVGTLFFAQDQPREPRTAAVAADPTGAIVAAIPTRTFGRQELVRLTSDGSRESSFAPSPHPGIQALAVDSRGRIIVSIGVEQRLVVLRFLPDGELDSSFGEDGRASVFAAPGTVGRLEGKQGTVLTIDDFGRVMVGRVKTARTSSRHGTGFLVARFAPNGSLDPSFGEGGVLTASIGHTTPYRLDALSLDSASGEVTLLSTAFEDLRGPEGPQRKRIELHRFLPDGSADFSFGSGGAVRIAVGRLGTAASAIAVDRGGRTVVGGSNGRGFGFARITQNGRLDPTFGRRGRLIYPVPSPRDATLSALATDRRDRVLVAVNARVRRSPLEGITAFRLRPTGGLDRSFGLEGFCTASFPGWETAATATLPQGRSAIVAGIASRPAPGYYPPTAPRLRALALARCRATRP